MPDKEHMPVGTKAKWKKGLTISEVEGELTEVYQTKSRPSTVKPGEEFITQGAKLKTQYGTISINLAGCQIPRSWRGHKVKIESTEDGKGKVKGIEYNTYDSDKGGGEELKIGYYGKFSGDNLPAESEQDHGHSSGNGGGSRTVYTDANPNDVIKAAILVHVGVNNKVRKVYAADNLDEETLRTYVNSVFIEVNKQGIMGGVIAAVVDGGLSKDEDGALPTRKKPQEEDRDQRPENNEEDFPQAGGDDDDFPSAGTPDPEEDDSQDSEAVKYDYGTVTLPKNKNIPVEFQGKKFAQLWTADGGKEYLQNLCLAFNSRGFNKDFEKALRSFCVDFKLVTIAKDDKEKVEAVF